MGVEKLQDLLYDYSCNCVFTRTGLDLKSNKFLDFYSKAYYNFNYRKIITREVVNRW